LYQLKNDCSFEFAPPIKPEKQMKPYILFVFASLLIHTLANAQYCTDNDRFTQTPVFTDAQIDYDTAVVYGNALNYQGQNQDLLLNICYPSAAADTMTKRPLVILMHGGGFYTGNRNDMNSMCVEFSKRGYVAATIGYRLGWDVGTSGCDGDTISDVKAVYRGFQDAYAAIRYLVENADTYGIDTAWIFSGGESAGGVNSLNLAFVSQSEMNTRYPFLQPELGNINNSGNSLTNTFSLKAVFNNWGSLVDMDFLTATNAIPMIAFHGDADDCLPIDSGTYSNCPGYVKMYGSRTIFNKLQTLGVCAELTVKPGGDHGIYDESLTQDIFRVNRASCFFKSLFCNTCAPAYITDSIAANCTSTGFGDFENKNRIQVYPNPSNGKFVVEIDGGKHIAAFTEVYNALGEKVFATTNNSQDEFIGIDLSGFPAGLYFISVYLGEKTIVEKVMIER
jgi:poly(3-hydroxybutyrate) depolymerase